MSTTDQQYSLSPGDEQYQQVAPLLSELDLQAAIASGATARVCMQAAVELRRLDQTNEDMTATEVQDLRTRAKHLARELRREVQYRDDDTPRTYLDRLLDEAATLLVSLTR